MMKLVGGCLFVRMMVKDIVRIVVKVEGEKGEEGGSEDGDMV